MTQTVLDFGVRDKLTTEIPCAADIDGESDEDAEPVHIAQHLVANAAALGLLAELGGIALLEKPNGILNDGLDVVILDGGGLFCRLSFHIFSVSGFAHRNLQKVNGLSCPNEKTPLTVEVKGVGGAAVQIDSV